MSVTIRWPDKTIGTPGIAIHSDTRNKVVSLWIDPPGTGVQERDNAIDEEDTFLMDDEELYKLLRMYAERKGILK